MTLHLDARQRAMLAEMGIRVFMPDAPAVARESLAREPMPSQPAAPLETGPARRAEVLHQEPLRATAAKVPVTASRPSSGIEAMDWPALEQAVASCQACSLCTSRGHPVFGVGDRQADWLIVADAPGEQEDLGGEPFVGAPGKLLDNMLAALGLDRQHKVYITNVLKCRPPGSRNPEPEEMAQCEPFLRRQVELLQPRIILAMGRFAVQSLLQTTEPIGKLRGRAHQYNGVPVVVTYHPAYLLRNLPDKAKAWADLCLAQTILREPR